MSAKDLVRQLAPAYKQCADCQKTLPSTAFGVRRRQKDNLCPRCIICERARAKRKRDAHPEREALYKQRWLSKRPGYKADWQRRTPELRKARGARYGDRNICKEKPAPDTLKTCRRCSAQLPMSDFGVNSRHSDGRQPRCRQCMAFERAKKYGLTETAAREMLEKQRGLCAVCKADIRDTFAIDHSHHSGRVRGLLCSLCNIGIGYMHDDPQICEAAAAYLRSQLEWQHFETTQT